MNELRVLPFLHEYVKTNYFTAIFVVLLTLLVSFKYWLPSLRRKKPVHSLSNRKIIVLFLIALAGIGIRLGWIGFCHYRPAFSWSEITEKKHGWTEYDEINIYASSIAKGEWFHNSEGRAVARRPIGYPVVLGLLYSALGTSTRTLYGSSLVFYVLTMILIWALTRQLFDEQVGLAAAALFSFYPLAIYSFSLPLDEHLFLPLWYFGIYLLFREIKGDKIPFAPLWYGLIFGYATMTRTHTVFMPLVVGFTYFLMKRPFVKIVMAFFVVWIVMQAVTLPWVIRNYREWKIIVPYTTSSWVDFYNANNSIVRGNSNARPLRKGDEGYRKDFQEAQKAGDVAKVQRIAKEETVRWVKNHPKEFMFLSLERVLHFMAWTRERGLWAIDLVQEGMKLDPARLLSARSKKITEEIGFAAYYTLFYSFILALVWLWRRWTSFDQVRRRSLLVAGACFFLYLAEHFIIWPERKYRYPIEPFMMMGVSAFFIYLVRDFKPLPQKKR